MICEASGDTELYNKNVHILSLERYIGAIQPEAVRQNVLKEQTPDTAIRGQKQSAGCQILSLFELPAETKDRR